MIKGKYPDVVVKGRDLFDAGLFKDTTSTSLFYTFMSELKKVTNKAHVTPTHQFIKHLHDSTRLLRCYTQNIDGLESKVGLDTDLQLSSKDVRVIQLHGDLKSVICTLCHSKSDFTDDHLKIFDKGIAPICPCCESEANLRKAMGKRERTIGTLRPNIVLYNEHHAEGMIMSLVMIKYFQVIKLEPFKLQI